MARWSGICRFCSMPSSAYPRSYPVTFVLALPPASGFERTNFWEPIRDSSIQVIEGSTWDTLAQAELALAASGTVTIEAALLGVPPW